MPNFRTKPSVKDDTKVAFNSKEGKDTEASKSDFHRRGKGDRRRTNGYKGSRNHPNDPSWYASNPQLLTASASLSYNQALGTYIDRSTSDVDIEYTTYAANTIPGVMSFEYIPSIGVSTDGNSPVNVQTKLIYTYVRHVNSGHSNYDPVDYMMYLLGIDQLYAMYAWLVRIYGTASLYSYTNRYYPDALLSAMGVNPSDIRAHLADLHYYICSICPRIASMAVPGEMTYTKRHFWLNSNLWSDHNSEKSQTYLFTPAGFWRLDETADPAKLLFVPLNPQTLGQPTSKTFDELKLYCDSIINAMLDSEDVGVMSGDTLKAFGNNILTISPIEREYTIAPIYNEEVLSQIENAWIYPVRISDDGDNSTWSNLDIMQVGGINGHLVYNPTYVGYPTMQIDRVLNMRIDHPEPKDTMVATRLMNIPAFGVRDLTSSKSRDTTYTWLSLGSEVLIGAHIWTKNIGGSGGAYSIDALGSVTMPTVAANRFLPSVGSRIAAITNFDWHPLVHLVCYKVTGQKDALQELGIVGDIANFAVLSSAVLDKMNDTAMLSMFNVPSMGQWSMK